MNEYSLEYLKAEIAYRHEERAQSHLADTEIHIPPHLIRMLLVVASALSLQSGSGENTAYGIFALMTGSSFSSQDSGFNDPYQWNTDTINYFINTHSAPTNTGNGSEVDFGRAIVRATNTINALPGSHPLFVYSGETPATAHSRNGISEIFFAPLPPQDDRAGVTIAWYTNNQGETVIEEADTLLNSTFHLNAAGVLEGDELDTESVALHELFHGGGFVKHSSNKGAVMYHSTPRGVTRRIPSQEDIDRLLVLYP